MVEATDNLLLFAPSLSSLHAMCIHMEWFQFAYGWHTAWEKSEVIILNSAPSPIQSVSMPTTDLSPSASSYCIPMTPVSLHHDQIQFLHVSMNDPASQFRLLSSLVSTFLIPKSHHHFPLSVLQKIINQLLISTIWAHISLHQVLPSQASSLQSMISSLVHTHLPFPFHPSPDILFSPSNSYGFGFISIPHLNSSLALNGLLQDLNHHIFMFQQMACITIADWECSILHCIFPFSLSGLKSSFLHHCCSLPFSFILAHNVL